MATNRFSQCYLNGAMIFSPWCIETPSPLENINDPPTFELGQIFYYTLSLELSPDNSKFFYFFLSNPILLLGGILLHDCVIPCYIFESRAAASLRSKEKYLLITAKCLWSTSTFFFLISRRFLVTRSIDWSFLSTNMSDEKLTKLLFCFWL